MTNQLVVRINARNRTLQTVKNIYVPIRTAAKTARLKVVRAKPASTKVLVVVPPAIRIAKKPARPVNVTTNVKLPAKKRVKIAAISNKQLEQYLYRKSCSSTEQLFF